MDILPAGSTGAVNDNTALNQAPNLGALDQLQSKAQSEGASGAFMNPGKKKPGRKSNAEREALAKASQDQQAKTAAAQAIPTAVIVKPLVQLLSGAGQVWAEHPSAAMKPEEIEGGAQALGLVLDKWMPAAMQAFGPEIMLGMVFGQYGMRVWAIRSQVKALKAEHAKNGGAPGKPGEHVAEPAKVEPVPFPMQPANETMPMPQVPIAGDGNAWEKPPTV